MRQISLIIFLGLAFSLCNLTEKLKPKGGNTKPPTTTPSRASSNHGDPVEVPNPTAAQITALAGGQEVKWDQQGIIFTVPPKWTEATNETKMLVWRSPGSWDAASLIVNISLPAENFPTEMSLNGFYENARTRAKNGEVDEVKWLAIDGVKGLQFREANPEQPDDQRRLQCGSAIASMPARYSW